MNLVDDGSGTVRLTYFDGFTNSNLLRVFWIPKGGGHVCEETLDRNGLLDRQVCERLSTSGNALEATEDTLALIIRREYKRMRRLRWSNGGQCDECGSLVTKRMSLKGNVRGIDVCQTCASGYTKAQGGYKVTDKDFLVLKEFLEQRAKELVQELRDEAEHLASELRYEGEELAEKLMQNNSGKCQE